MNNILKLFTLSLFILSGALIFSMEEENVEFKGFINLSDEPINLRFGRILNPSLYIDLQPRTGKLVDYSTQKGKEFIIANPHRRAKTHSVSGENKQFIIVQRSLSDYIEIPVS